MVEYLLAASIVVSACDPSARPLIVAHRGGLDSELPENTLPAFQRAADVGADVIELDLRATRDGHVVALHDPHVNRTTNGHGFVHEMSLRRLRRYRAGPDVVVPTLDEVLQGLQNRDVELLFDVKRAPGLDHGRIVRTVTEHHDPRRVVFGVRSLEDRARFAADGADLRFLGMVPKPDDIEAFLSAGVEAIRLWPGWLAREPSLVAQVHAGAARVWVTAGNAGVDELGRLAALGVDAVLTDRPAEAAAAFRCR